MGTRIHLIFDGGPDDEEHHLREVADHQNEPLVFGHLARWIPLSRAENIWVLEIDAERIDRPPVVTVCASSATDALLDTVSELDALGRIVLKRESPLNWVLNQDDDTIAKERHRQFERIAMSDWLFVLNENINRTDGEILAMKAEIAYARDLKKRVQYLRYDDDIDWSSS